MVCADVERGKSVAALGLGPVGLFSCEWSKLVGPSRVIAIDRMPARLSLAKKMGCDVINFEKHSDVVGQVQKLEPEGVSCAIDDAAFRYTKGLLQSVERTIALETDSSEIPDEKLRAVRKFGTISLVAD